MNSPRLPSHTELLLPLLHEIDAAGGAAKPGSLYDRIAERLNLDPEIRDAVATHDPDTNLFQRRVRWVRQTCVAKQLIEPNRRGIWSLTDHARAHLGNIVRGTIVTVFLTNAGFALWANAEDAAAIIDRGSVQLIVTSPPYPLARPRDYGNRAAREWTDWMLRLIESWNDLLTHDGSIMLNLGPTYTPGAPTQSLYMERLLVRLEDTLGVHLLQRLDWYNPTKFPASLKWTGIDRRRVKNAVEPVFWLSRNALAKGDNRNVLVPYASSTLRTMQHPKTNDQRDCGYTFGARSFVDRGGAIPPSLITATPTRNPHVKATQRTLGLTPHPAVMPERLAHFVISLASEENDLVYDPLAGDGTVAIVAERLNRRYITSERSLRYIDGAAVRAACEGFRVQYPIATA